MRNFFTKEKSPRSCNSQRSPRIIIFKSKKRLHTFLSLLYPSTPFQINFSIFLESLMHLLLAFKILISCVSGIIRMNPPSGSQLTVFLAGKLFFLIYRVVIPCLVLPVWKVVSRLKREFRAHTNRMTSRALRSRVPKMSRPPSPTLPHPFRQTLGTWAIQRCRIPRICRRVSTLLDKIYTYM